MNDSSEGAATVPRTLGVGRSDEPAYQQKGVAWAQLPFVVSRPASRRVRRILLVFPPVTLFHQDIPRCTYPLGIGYVAAVLERYGYEVRLLDAFAAGYHNVSPIEGDADFVQYGLSDEAIANAMRDYEPDVVGVSSIFSNQADNVHRVLAIAKHVRPDVVTAIGGAHARYQPRACLEDPNLDAVLLGEAELTFLEFVEYLNGAHPAERLRGIALRHGGDVRVYPDTVLLGERVRSASGAWAELDSLPFPAWHLYDMERYFALRAYQSPYTRGNRVGQVYTSRGCSAHCTFCTTTNFWANRLRRRSPESVLDELTALRDRYGIDEFHVQDDNITNDMAHARQLFKAFAKLGLPWATPQGTALWRMDEELVDLMVASGAYQITFAIESAAPRVLTELIRKPLDLSRTAHLIRYAKAVGLNVHGFFIVGMPPMFGHAGETVEEMWASYHFAESAGFDSASFFTATPIIGSALLSECMRQGFVDPAVRLYQMSYKQGLISVPGLWQGVEVAELAGRFNYEFNHADRRPNTIRRWSSSQY